MENKYKATDFEVGDLFVASLTGGEIICEVLPEKDSDMWKRAMGFVHSKCFFGPVLGEVWIVDEYITLRIDKSRLMRR